MSTRVSDAAGLPDDEAPRLTRVLEEIERQPRGEEIERRPAGAEIERRSRGDDRIRELISALGDPNHPQHAQAVSELVAIGPRAVGPLGAALSPDRPWLTSYRAAEALAQIGDGRASGALISALRHPNSNVRWSVVRALAEVGDTRTLWALRRVAHEDRGKTSWGESVADTAQFALDRLQSHSALLRFTEPVKTALMFVAMFAALLFAVDRAQAVVSELRRDVPAPNVQFSPPKPTAVAGSNGAKAPAPAPAPATPTPTSAPPSATPTSAPPPATPTPVPAAAPPASPPPNGPVGTVRLRAANVRSAPSLGNNVVGYVYAGDDIVFLGSSGDWFLIRLGDKKSNRSRIRGDQGWVSRVAVNAPPDVPGIAPTPNP